MARCEIADSHIRLAGRQKEGCFIKSHLFGDRLHLFLCEFTCVQHDPCRIPHTRLSTKSIHMIYCYPAHQNLLFVPVIKSEYQLCSVKGFFNSFVVIAFCITRYSLPPKFLSGYIFCGRIGVQLPHPCKTFKHTNCGLFCQSCSSKRL
ncbi:hypothetical protein D3C80_1535000 [compost metagenome]